MKKIVADSTCDLVEIKGLEANVEFGRVPLKIIVEKEEFVDDDRLDLDKMLNALSETKGSTSTACPSPGEFYDAFGDAKEVFVVTITSKLSGSYSSAVMAKKMYEEEYPDRKVYVCDSLSTSGEMVLIIDKINFLIKEKKSFEEIVEEIEQYKIDNTHLDFILYNVDNLVKNGRLNKIVGTAMGVLGIKIVGRANEGVLQPFAKIRGKEKVFDCVLKDMLEKGYNGGNVHISHCNNEEGALTMKNKILEFFPKAKIIIRNAKGLVSYYAEEKGVLIGFES